MSEFTEKFQRDLTSVTRQVFEREESFKTNFNITIDNDIDYFYMSGSLCLIGLEDQAFGKRQITIKTTALLVWIK